MRTNTIRLLSAATIGVLPVIALAWPALAGGATSDQDLRTAYVQWLGEGGIPGVLGGNVHRGAVSATDDLATPGVDMASGRLEAWTCPAGVTPPALGEVEIPEAPPTPCAFVGARDLRIDPAALTVGNGLVDGRLTGSASATDPTGGAGNVAMAVDLTFAAAGPVVPDTLTHRWEDETGRHSSRTTFALRDANVSGSVGGVSVAAARWQQAHLHSQVGRVH